MKFVVFNTTLIEVVISQTPK